MFTTSALSRTGIGNVAGTALVATANHLTLGWHSSVASQVASRLN
ncbi:hypothetical protein ABZW11_07340 [Nonomuraea sp. NPDC004580]